MVNEILEVENRGGGLNELMPLISGERMRKAWESGDVEDAPIMAGQSVGLIHDVPTCKELLDRMATEAEQEIAKFYKAHTEQLKTCTCSRDSLRTRFIFPVVPAQETGVPISETSFRTNEARSGIQSLLKILPDPGFRRGDEIRTGVCPALRMPCAFRKGRTKSKMPPCERIQKLSSEMQTLTLHNSPLKKRGCYRPVKNDDMQGAHIPRNEADIEYVAVTRDEAPRGRLRSSTA